MTVPLTELVNTETLDRLRALAGTSDQQEEPTVDPDVEEIKADPTVIEHKADLGAQVLEADAKTGLVRAIVSITGVEDKVKDIIEPGAYTETMKAREPIGVWSHDDKTWVARTEDAKEYFPGDPFFKGLKTMDGQDWPAAAGAVVVDARFNLATPHGAAAFSDVDFFKGKTGWSIGYRATKAFRNIKTGVRRIKALDWFEYSPVMVGAASQPMTLSVKSMAQGVDPNDPAGLADDVLVESLSADELGRYKTLLESVGLEFKDRVRTADGQRRFGQPIGSVIIPDGLKGSAPLTDADLDKMTASAKAKGDTQEVRMLDAARKMPPAKRREALTKGTAGNDQPGLAGRMAAAGGKAPSGDDAARAASGLVSSGQQRALDSAPAIKPSRNAKLADHLMDVQDKLEGEGRHDSASEVGGLLDEMIDGKHDDDGGAHIAKVLSAISGDTTAASSIDGALAELPAAKPDKPGAAGAAGGSVRATDAEKAPHQAAAAKLSGDLTAAGHGIKPAGDSGPKKPAASPEKPSTDRSAASAPQTAAEGRAAARAEGAPALPPAGLSPEARAAYISEYQHNVGMKERAAARGDGPPKMQPATTPGAGRGVNPEAARERADRADRAHARDLAGNAAADARIAERAKLAAVNKRRRAQGKAPLLKLPENMKALDLAETTDVELEAKAAEAWAVGDLEVDVDGLEEKRSRASLDTHPNSSNWVEKAGDLPGYIREVARAIHEDHGKPLDEAIPMAIGRIKRWAAGGGDVTAETRAKAAAAVAQWEALKAKAGKKSDSALLADLETKALALDDAPPWAGAEDGDLGPVLADFDLLEAVEAKAHTGSEDLVDISDLLGAAAELKTWDMLDRAGALKRDF